MAADAIQSYLIDQPDLKAAGYVPGTPEFDNLLQLASLAVGAAVGGSSGGATALSATQHNYLNHGERMEYLEAALQCSQAGESCGRAAELEVLSESRNEVLKTACTDRYSGACQDALQSAKAAFADHQANQSEYLAWMTTNAASLLSADNPLRGDESLVPNVVTHTTTADLVWKLDCATAGSDCSKAGSFGALQQGDVASAARHEAMRSLLQGAGQVGGVGGRAVDTVVGLYDLLKNANAVNILGEALTAIEYVNQYGLQAYLDVEQKKSTALWSGLWDSGKGYVSDIGSAIGDTLEGGSQWDIYDVYMQGNTEGKVGFDVLGLLVGATELNAAGKTALADRVGAKALKQAAKDMADDAARVTQRSVDDVAIASRAADAEAGGFSYYDKYRKSDGEWDWPKNAGFAGNSAEATLPVGTKLDRYGGPDGAFLSPKGTPFDDRALAPGSRANGYHTYEVIKPLPVLEGEIAPAFGKPGGGTQVLPRFSERVNVEWLIDNKYLKEVD